MIGLKHVFFRIISICIVFFYFAPLNTYAQNVNEQYEYLDSKYGKNQLLYQGELYVANKRCDFGNPFLFTTTAQVGKISYDNNIYTNLLLKYNASSQRLVLVFIDNFGAERYIMLNGEKVDWFYLGDNYFVKNRYDVIKEKFYEEIDGINNIKCLLSYKKKYGFENRTGNAGFGYSDLTIKKYLLIDKTPILFKNKKDFLKLLPLNFQPLAQKYIKNNRVRFKNWNGANLKLLFEFLTSSELPNHE